MLCSWQFSADAQAVQSFQFVDATRSFLHVSGSKSAIRCILRSVRKLTLVIFGTFEVEKSLPHRPDTFKYRDVQSFSLRLKSEKLTV